MMSERRAGVATQSRAETWQFHFSLQRSGVRSRTPRRVVSRLAPRAVRDRPRDGIPRARRRRDRLCGEDAGPPPRFPRQRRSARRRSVGEHAHGFSRGRVVSDAPRMPGPPRASSLRRMRRVRRYRRGRARARRGTLRRRRRPGRRLRATTRRDRPGRAQILRRHVAAWIRAAGFRAVIALASVPSTAARTPDVIGATLFRHVTASGAPDPRCEALKHPRVAVPYAESEVGPSTPDAALPPWSLLRACAAEGVDATCVVAVCSEGDNSDDARDMADVVAGVLGLDGDDRGNDRGDDRGDDHGTIVGTLGMSRRRVVRAPPSWASAYGRDVWRARCSRSGRRRRRRRATLNRRKSEMRVRFSARRVASRRVMLFIGMTRCRPARGETARGPDAIDRPPLRTFALRRRGFEPRPVRVFLSYVLFRGRFGSTRSDIGRADDDTCSGTGTGTLQVRRDRRDSKRGARRGFPTRIFPRARPPWPRAAASARARRPTPRRRPRLQSPRRGPNGGGTRVLLVPVDGSASADDHGPPMGRGERPSPGGPRPRPHVVPPSSWRRQDTAAEVRRRGVGAPRGSWVVERTTRASPRRHTSDHLLETETATTLLRLEPLLVREKRSLRLPRLVSLGFRQKSAPL